MKKVTTFLLTFLLGAVCGCAALLGWAFMDRYHDQQAAAMVAGEPDVAYQFLVRSGQLTAMDAVLNETLKSSPGLGPEFRAKFMERAAGTFPELVSQYITTEDLAAAINFYDSPAGRRIANALPKLTLASSKLGEQLGEELGKEIEVGIKADKRRSKKY